MTKNKQNKAFTSSKKLNLIQNYRKTIGEYPQKKTKKPLNNVNNNNFNIPRFRIPEDNVRGLVYRLRPRIEREDQFSDNGLRITKRGWFFLSLQMLVLASKYKEFAPLTEQNTLQLADSSTNNFDHLFTENEVYVASMPVQFSEVSAEKKLESKNLIVKNMNKENRNFTFSDLNTSFEQILQANLDPASFSDEQNKNIVKVFKILPEKTKERLKNLMLIYQNINQKPFIRFVRQTNTEMSVSVNKKTDQLALCLNPNSLKLIQQADLNSNKLTALNIVLEHEIFHAIDGLVAKAPNRIEAVRQKDVENYTLCKTKFDYSLLIFNNILNNIDDRSLTAIADALIEAKSPYLDTLMRVTKNSPIKTKQLFLKQIFTSLVNRFDQYQKIYTHICGDFFAILGSELSKELNDLAPVLNQMETWHHHNKNIQFNPLTTTRLGDWVFEQSNNYEERFNNLIQSLNTKDQKETQQIRKEFSTIFSTEAIENLLRLIFLDPKLKNDLLKIVQENQKLKHSKPLFQSLQDIFIDEKGNLVLDLDRLENNNSLWNLCRRVYAETINNQRVFANQYDFEKCGSNQNTHQVTIVGSRTGNPNHVEKLKNQIPLAPEISEKAEACDQFLNNKGNDPRNLQTCLPQGSTLNPFILNGKTCTIDAKNNRVSC